MKLNPYVKRDKIAAIIKIILTDQVKNLLFIKILFFLQRTHNVIVDQPQ